MIYNLNDPLHRQQFKLRVQNLYKKGKVVELVDKSVRTVNQNSYLHVLIRILAVETGVTESYAKDEYFKRQANPDTFVEKIIDPISKEEKESLKESSKLSVDELSKCIDRFRMWSEEQGIYLPEAHLKGSGDEMEFKDDDDRLAFEQAIVETGRLEKYL